MVEIWKDIKGYVGRYQISTYGRVKSLGGRRLNGRYFTIFKDKIMKPGKKKGNFYYVIQIMKNAKCKFFSVHKLVATHFIKNPKNKSQINHMDGNKLNNNVDNLEWMTQQENTKHAEKNGLFKRINGEINGMSKLKKEDVLKIRKMFKEGLCVFKIAKMFNVSAANISYITLRKSWKHLKEE